MRRSTSAMGQKQTSQNFIEIVRLVPEADLIAVCPRGDPSSFGLRDDSCAETAALSLPFLCQNFWVSSKEGIDAQPI